MTVKQERTGWRDQVLSQRHRTWGFDCPALDLDFILAEYDTRVPVALIDYKHGLNWEPRAADRSNMAVLAELGSGYRCCTECGGRGLPSLIVKYEHGPLRFKLGPLLNAVAEARIPLAAVERVMGEEWFVRLLYYLRGRPVPEEILVMIRNAGPSLPFPGIVAAA